MAWLPEDLDSVALRLARVDGLVFELGQLAMNWSQNDPLELAPVETQPNQLDLTVEAVRPIPPMMSLMFSEAVHHLRAAIENTVYYTVETGRGAPLSEKQANAVAMPVSKDAAGFEDWQKQRVQRGVPELGPGTTLGTRIQKLQPYADSAAGMGSTSQRFAELTGTQMVVEHPMVLLQRYSNLDKHRALRVAAAQGIVDDINAPLGSNNRALRTLTVGDVLISCPLGTPVVVDVWPVVAIQRPTSQVWVAPVPELDNLHWYVSNIAIPSLLLHVIPPPPAMPPGIDLGDTGQRPRQRMESAGQAVARERLEPLVRKMLQEGLKKPVKIPPVGRLR